MHAAPRRLVVILAWQRDTLLQCRLQLARGHFRPKSKVLASSDLHAVQRQGSGWNRMK